MIIRIAEMRDLESIVEIYNQAIQTKLATADLQPVDVNSKSIWFQQHTPDQYPIFVSEIDHMVVGWISLSPYRPGREALRYTKEISYYVHEDYQRQGIGSGMVSFIIRECPKFEVKSLFAIILQHNTPSINLVKRFNFEQWGLMPKVADFNGKELDHLYYGLRVQR